MATVINGGINLNPSFALPFLITLIINTENMDDIMSINIEKFVKSLIAIPLSEKLNEKNPLAPDESSISIFEVMLWVVDNNCVASAKRSGAAPTVATPINIT